MKIGLDGLDLDTIGGGQIDVSEIVKIIQKKNHPIKIFSNRRIDEKKMYDLYGIKNIEIIPLNSKLNVSLNSLLLRFFLKRNPVDCFIKCNWFIPPKEMPYFNYALFPHNLFLYEKYSSKILSSDFKKILYWTLQISQEKLLDVSGKYSLCNIAQSKFVKKLFWALYKIRYKVIYPPVHQEDLYVSNKEPNSIIAVGRITKEKRYDILIKLAKKYPEFNFKIVGGFNYSRKDFIVLKELMRNVRILKNLEVFINLSRKKLVELLSKSQFLLHLMPYEHFGMAIVEAMACGITPIVHQNSGPSELIKISRYGSTYRNHKELTDKFDQFVISKPVNELTSRAQYFSSANFRKKISPYLYEFLDLVEDKKMRGRAIGMRGRAIGMRGRAIKMNICYFAPNIPYRAPHAGYTHTINVCKKLQEKGNNVLIIFQGEKYREFKEDGLSIITVPTWGHKGSFSIFSMLRLIPILMKLIKICKKYQIDLIHERSGLPRGIGIIAAKVLKIKSITEINTPFIEEYELNLERIFRIWRKFMFKLTDKIITQTTLLKKILSKDVESDKIQIVSNGVDPNSFDPNKIDGTLIRNKYNIQKDTVLIIFVGAFHRWHGVEQIITIAEQLKKEKIDAKFLLVGEGPLFSLIRDEVNKKKLTNNVILTGGIDYSEIPKYLASADIAIAPFSYYSYKPLVKNGFWWCPVKLFEYAAMGKPVVSISAGDIPQIIPHNHAALLSPPNDFNQLINNLKKLINSKELREKLGSNGRQHVIKNFSWTMLAEKIIKMYNY